MEKSGEGNVEVRVNNTKCAKLKKRKTVERKRVKYPRKRTEPNNKKN